MQKISAHFVKKFKPRKKRYDFRKDNLEIIVHPTGRVVFNTYTSMGGEKVREKLGTFDSCDLEASQIKHLQETYADNYHRYLAGKRPETPREEAQRQALERKAQRERLEEARQQAYYERMREKDWQEKGWESDEFEDEVRFEDLFDMWSKAEGFEKKSFANDERIYNRDLAPLHKMPLFAITRDTLVEVIQGVNGKVQPNRAKSLLSRVFNWGIENSYVKNTGIVYRLPTKRETKRTRLMSDKEIRNAWPHMRPVFRFLLLTGQRREEVASMQWDHIEGDSWTLPETKNSFPHLVRIPKFAMDQLPKREGVWVWKQRRTKREPDKDLPIHPDTLNDWWGKDRDALGLSDVTPHDFRRTVITGLTRVTKNDTIGRKVANQALQGVKKVYDLYAWDDEKADALKKWNAFIKKLVKG